MVQSFADGVDDLVLGGPFCERVGDIASCLLGGKGCLSSEHGHVHALASEVGVDECLYAVHGLGLLVVDGIAGLYHDLAGEGGLVLAYLHRLGLLCLLGCYLLLELGHGLVLLDGGIHACVLAHLDDFFVQFIQLGLRAQCAVSIALGGGLALVVQLLQLL